MILYKNIKAIVSSPDGDTVFFDIVTGVWQGDILTPQVFILCRDHAFLTLIDLTKENGITLT